MKKYLWILLLPFLLAFDTHNGTIFRDGGKTNWCKHPNIAACYRMNTATMNDTQNVLFDESGNDNHCDISDVLVEKVIANCPFDDSEACLDFESSSSQSVPCGSDASVDDVMLNGGTIVVRVNPESTGNYESWVVKRTSSTGGYWFQDYGGSTGSLSFFHYCGASDLWIATAANQYSTETDHCFAVTWDGTTGSSSDSSVLLYIDGILNTSTRLKTDDCTSPAGSEAGDDLTIGSVTGDTSDYADGNVDEVAIFSSVLSALEIKEICDYGL